MDALECRIEELEQEVKDLKKEIIDLKKSSSPEKIASDIIKKLKLAGIY